MFATATLASLLPLLVSSAYIAHRFPGPTSTETPTSVSAQEISNKFVRPAQFSQLAYCSSSLIKSWNCGSSCQALQMGSFTPITVGGDGQSVPYFFVGHDNMTQSIVVAHQGTDPSSIRSLLNDAESEMGPMSPTLFPNVGSDVRVHTGFARAHGRSADEVLSAVKSGLQSTGTSSVLVTGHSLGAAIAAMDALMLHQNLDPSVSINTVVFGLPRGGNDAFANLIDSQLGIQFTYVTHGNDPVPNQPPRSLGYQHSSGEVYIPSSGEAGTVACAGQENLHCVEGNSVLHASISDHLGPYFSGTMMGRSACPL
ncbi:alpha/beta-hydrolase [Russula compacta]|nr:alpha/beta-hydrolase [Russula compacta]